MRRIKRGKKVKQLSFFVLNFLMLVFLALQVRTEALPQNVIDTEITAKTLFSREVENLDRSLNQNAFHEPALGLSGNRHAKQPRGS
jgi:hypothetical protein